MSELTDNINKLTFRVYEEPKGGFSTRCTEFPGIITQGDSKEDLKRMILDAVDCYFDSFPMERAKISELKNNKIEIIF